MTGSSIPASERIVSLLWVLLTSGSRGVSRDYLRRYVDAYAAATSEAAFERMFSRDKDALKGIGVPLVSFTVSDTAGFESSGSEAETRYRVDSDQLFLPRIEFDNAERLALVRAASAWAGSEASHAVVRALGRLDAGEDWLAATAGSDHEAFGARLARADPHLTAVAESVRAQEVITFSYRTVDAPEATRRTVRAWSLINPRGIWYLVGWDVDRGAQRTFRLTRMESVPAVTAAAVAQGAPHRPADLDLEAVRDIVAGEEGPATTRLFLRPGHAQELRLGADPVTEGTPAPEGWDEVVLTYTRPAETAGRVAAAGPHAVVADPADPLHAAVTALLDAAVAAHRSPVPEYALTVPKARRDRRSEQDRVATLVDAIGLMNARGGMSRTELGSRLGVDGRGLDRILTELTLCGMPERYFAGEQFDVVEDGDHVWIRQAEALSGPLRLSVPEAASLVIGLRATAGIPGLRAEERQAAATALARILEVSGDEVAGAAEGIEAGFDFGDQTALAGRLHEDARDHRLLEITYHSASRDEQSVRVVEPERILMEGGHGYLRAWCRTRGAVRNFRLDRIGEVRDLNEHVTPRPETGAEGIFTPHGTETAAVVHFAHRVRDLAAGYAPSRTAVLADGSVVAEVPLSTVSYAAAQSARHGGGFRVLTPEGFVTATLDWLGRAREGYRRA